MTKGLLNIIVIGLLVLAGCSKDKNSVGNSNNETAKQAYITDLSGCYSSASGNGTAMAIRIQKDGKILVLGYQWFIRLEQDGVTVDKSFNPVDEIASSAKVTSFELQDDGKIIVFGHFVLSSGRRAIIRLNSDGTIDNSFNIPDINFDYFTRNVAGPGIEAIKILENGKMIVAGQFEYKTGSGTYSEDIARLNADQSIDHSFSSPIGVGDTYGITNMLPLENGSFLLSGYGAIQLKDGNNYNVVKINADGVYDNSFVYNSGSSGNVSVIIGDMKELSDGKLLMGGTLGSGYANSILRFSSTGNVDISFKEFAFNETVKSLLVLPDQSILLGFDPNRNLPTEYRYLNYINPEGIEDTTFDIGFTNASVQCLMRVDGNTILAGGNFTLNNVNYSVIRLKKNQ